MSARFASIAAGQQRPPDYENYLQCHQCGNIIPVYEAASTPQIKNSTETIDNALEQGKFVLDRIPKRGTIKGNKEADKRRILDKRKDLTKDLHLITLAEDKLQRL